MFDVGLIVGVYSRGFTLIVFGENYGVGLERKRGRPTAREMYQKKDGGCLARTQSCPANRIIINYDTVRAREREREKRVREIKDERPSLISMKKSVRERKGERKREKWERRDRWKRL